MTLESETCPCGSEEIYGYVDDVPVCSPCWDRNMRRRDMRLHALVFARLSASSNPSTRIRNAAQLRAAVESGGGKRPENPPDPARGKEAIRRRRKLHPEEKVGE